MICGISVKSYVMSDSLSEIGEIYFQKIFFVEILVKFLWKKWNATNFAQTIRHDVTFGADSENHNEKF